MTIVYTAYELFPHIIIIIIITFSELPGSGPSHQQTAGKLPADSSYFFSIQDVAALAKVQIT